MHCKIKLFIVMRIRLFIIILLFSSCVYDPLEQSIFIQNTTDSAIYVYYTSSNSLPKEPALKLFVKEKAMDLPIQSPEYRINAHSNGLIPLYLLKVESDKSKDKKLKLYFITEKNIKEKKWDEIYKNQLYEKKITIVSEKLKKNTIIAIYK
jgi:hypothetical protein